MSIVFQEAVALGKQLSLRLGRVPVEVEFGVSKATLNQRRYRKEKPEHYRVQSNKHSKTWRERHPKAYHAANVRNALKRKRRIAEEERLAA